MLHEWDDRAAQGRPLFASGDCDPRPDGGHPAVDVLERRLPARRADVPRKRVVLSVLLPARGGEACLSRPTSRPGQPAGRVRLTTRQRQRRSSDDLDGHPAGARCRTGSVGPLGDADDDGRRLGTPARDDRRIRRATRHPHHARLGDDRDVPDRHDLRRSRSGGRAVEGRGVRQARHARPADPVRRDPRPRWRRFRALGRGDDGRARGPRPIGLLRLLRLPRERRPVDGGRLVQDGRHRHDPPRRLRRDPGPLEGPRQVRRRVDLDRRARERPHGPSRRARGRGDRGARREVVRAPAGGDRLPGGQDCERRRVARVPGPEFREMVAAGAVRSRRRDPEDGGRQVPQDRLARGFATA